MILKIAVVCLYAVFIFLSAFFSSCEITFARANHKRLKDAADAGDKRAAKAVFINDNYTRSLSTILVGNNLVNIAASSTATMFFVKMLKVPNGEAVATVVTTLLLITFGETLPKIIAADRPCARVRRPPAHDDVGLHAHRKRRNRAGKAHFPAVDAARESAADHHGRAAHHP